MGPRDEDKRRQKNQAQNDQQRARFLLFSLRRSLIFQQNSTYSFPMGSTLGEGPPRTEERRAPGKPWESGRPEAV